MHPTAVELIIAGGFLKYPDDISLCQASRPIALAARTGRNMFLWEVVGTHPSDGVDWEARQTGRFFEDAEYRADLQQLFYDNECLLRATRYLPY